MSAPNIRLRDQAGQGQTIAFLQAPNARASAAVAMLAREFRVQTYEVAPDAAADEAAKAIGATPIGLIASQPAARLALDLALAQPGAVNALALLAPPLDPQRDADTIKRLAGMTAPLLALFGTRGALGLPPAGRLLRQSVPNCHVTFVYDAGDDLDSERPEAVAAALSEFMRTRERYLVTTQSGKLYP